MRTLRFDRLARQSARAQFVEREHAPLRGGEPREPHIRSIVTSVRLQGNEGDNRRAWPDRGADRVTDLHEFAPAFALTPYKRSTRPAATALTCDHMVTYHRRRRATGSTASSRSTTSRRRSSGSGTAAVSHVDGREGGAGRASIEDRRIRSARSPAPGRPGRASSWRRGAPARAREPKPGLRRVRPRKSAGREAG